MQRQYGNYQVRFGPNFTPMIKILIIINASVFIMQLVSGFLNFPFINVFFSLNPDRVSNFHIYQLVSYSFLHGSFMHLVLNMLALWMFGAELEEYWGKKNILIFYLFTAFTGGLLTWAVHFFYHQGIVVGASGAVFGIMCAYALIWPNREVLFMMFFPVKIKYLVFLIMIPMALLQPDPGIAHMAHLGGALGGILYFFLNRRYRFEFDTAFSWDDFMRRRKFKMYQEEMNSRLHVEEKVDELLDKISKKGFNSLSKKEKKFLNDASAKYYKEQ